MGMLMHHTWLEQQKEAEKQQKPVVPKEEKPVEPAEEPVVRKPGRRKATK